MKVELLVFRTSKYGSIGNSKCCVKCLYDLHRLPLRKGYIVSKIHYTNETGELVTTTLADLCSETKENMFITTYYRDQHCSAKFKGHGIKINKLMDRLKEMY
jgi:hypothetical protein